MRSRNAFTRTELLVVFVVMAGLFALLAPAVNRAREAARAATCLGRMCQLTLALHNYHSVYERFPPAYMVDERGKPIHSWRVL
ncbi:MAG: DUF1559 domain-containing protein, partial [Planctomycetes bacterium]|nr:DUF1559 domain-containing protein [Planctomycetota bacterium]